MLRNDTLKPELAGVLEHRRSNRAFHVLTELNAIDGLRQQLSQPFFAGVERLGADVVIADRQQIEGDEPDSSLCLRE
jgi:hypothetical protein